MSDRIILVPLDGSALAEAALPYARALATATGWTLHFLSVAEGEPTGLFGMSDTANAYVQTIQKESAKLYLGTIVRGLTEHGFAVSTALAEGDPAEAIIAAAAAPAVALIVMATHGLGGLERSIIGSVADNVMRTSPRPVLIVRPAAGIKAGQKLELRRLMVPLDGAAQAESALPLATQLATATGATLVLAQVHSATTRMPLAEHAGPYAGRAEAISDATQYLNDVKARIPAGVHAETAPLWGSVAETLEDFAHHQSVDLVVMSTHRRDGLPRFVLGSTADSLIRAGVPTLLVRCGRIRKGWLRR